MFGRLLFLCLIGIKTCTITQAGEFIPLGVEGGEPHAVSANGSFVVGSPSFRWSANGGVQTLYDNDPMPFDNAYDVSDDGTYVVGSRGDGSGPRLAYRWSEASGFTDLGSLPGMLHAFPGGISSDGSVIFGTAEGEVPELMSRAFRWTESSGMQDLGVLKSGDSDSLANGMSGDSMVIVGNSGVTNETASGFRWTDGSGMAPLDPLPNNSNSWAWDVSTDGRVTVGHSADGPEWANAQAVRWIEGSGIEPLGSIIGYDESVARHVSGDGSLIIGELSGDQVEDAYFYWTEIAGMRLLDDVLSDAGVGFPEGTTRYFVNDLSDGGNTIVGYYRSVGGGEQAYLIRLDTITVPEPSGIALTSMVIIGIGCYSFGRYLRRSDRSAYKPQASISSQWLEKALRAGALTITATLLCYTPTYAKKPDNTGGGGGGGQGGSELQLIDLQPDRFSSSKAFALSDAGLVVGMVDEVAGVWDATAATPTFSALPGNGQSALSVNKAGEIVGYGPAGPMYWAGPSALPIALPITPGFSAGTANGISLDGVVVGQLSGGSGDAAVAWRVTDGSRCLGLWSYH